MGVHRPNPPGTLSRREALKLMGLTGIPLFLAACGFSPTTQTPSPEPSVIPKSADTPGAAPTLPAPQVTATAASTATAEAPAATATAASVESLPITKDAVANYVIAMSKAGRPISSTVDVLKNGLDVKTITTDGIKHQVAFTKDGYPILIESEEGEWVNFTPQYSSEIKYTTAVDLGDENHNVLAYDKTTQMNFSGLVVSGGFAANSIDKYPPDHFVDELVSNPKLNTTRINLFDHNDLTPSADGQVIGNRINKLTPYIVRILKDPTKHIILDIANEAMWTNDAGQNGFEKGYGPDGNKWIINAGNQLISTLLANGVSVEQINNQIQIGIDNEYRVEIPSGLYAQKATFVLNNAKQFAEAIQKANPDIKLNFSMGMEFHIGTVDPDPNKPSHYFVDHNFFNSPNAEDQLTKHFRTFKDAGFKLNISEFDFDDSISIEEKVRILTIVVHAARRSENVSSVNFWNGLRSNTSSGWTNKPDLFRFTTDKNGEYEKTVIYYALCKALLDPLK